MNSNRDTQDYETRDRETRDRDTQDRDTSAVGRSGVNRDAALSLDDRDRALGLRPLTARSLLASMLLGTYPPRLPVRVLVAAAGLFGITEGSARTALSRMVAAGDVTARDGWYELGPSLIERQRRQDVGRKAERLPWDGSWRTLIVTADRRMASDRSAARAALLDERFAELREGVWLRPANLAHGAALDELSPQGWVSGRMYLDDPVDVDRLWAIEGWQRTASGLADAVEELTPLFEKGERTMLARGFVLAAAVLRHFRSDPLLPDELLSSLSTATMPAVDLRSRYDTFDRSYRSVLREFFEESRRAAD